MKKKSLVTVLICLISMCIFAGCKKEGPKDTADKTGEDTSIEESVEKEVKEEGSPKDKEELNEKDSGKRELDLEKAEESLKEMSDTLRGFLWVSMMSASDYSPMEAGDIDLSMSGEDKIRASVLACDADNVIDSTFVLGMGGFSEDKNADDGPDGDGFHGVSVAKKDVEEKCIDLFGTKAPWNELPHGPKCDLYDAVLYTDGNNKYPMIVERVVETETSLENHECTVIKEDDKYIGKVNMFWGYWGELEQKPGYSNYAVTYTLEQNDESRYGMVITSISISQTDNDPYERSENDNENGSSQNTGLSGATDGEFYGVFIKAFKSENDCDKTLSDLEEAGFINCPVVYTPDFEKLNPEPYYVVTAGLFTTKQAAEEALDKAKAGGFTDAYVKYAGSYKGDTVWYTMYSENGIEILKDGIFLHDVEVTIPYRTDGAPLKTDLFVREDTVFDKKADTASFAYYEKRDTPYRWIVRSYNLMKDDPDEYMSKGPVLTGVFEVSLDGDIVRSYHQSFWWD